LEGELTWGYKLFDVFSKIVYPAGVVVFFMAACLMAIRYWQVQRDRSLIVHLIILTLLVMYCLFESFSTFTSSISQSIALKSLALMIFALTDFAAAIMVFLGFVRVYDYLSAKQKEK
jgi:hypothetical protein